LIFLICAGVLIILTGIIFPTSLVLAFLFANLLVPKLPLIEIRGYLVPIRLEDVLLACALLALLLRYLFYREDRTRNPLERWMVIFSVLTGISFLFGLYILGSVPGATVGFLYWLRGPEYFAASYLCLSSVTNWKQYKRMMTALVAFTLLIGIYGILQEYSIVPTFNAMHQTDEFVTIQFSPGFGMDRLSSTFAGPYDLAAFYLLAIPILICLCVLAVSMTQKLMLAGILALSLVCFYLTYARTPLAALVMVVGVCLWFLGKARWGLFLVPAFVLPALLLEGFAVRLSSAADDPMAYYQLGGRITGGWADAISAAIRSPLIGTGPASLADGMGVDGLYFLLVGMWGIAGLVCFMTLIWKAIHFQRGYIRASQNKMQRALAIGLFAGTLGLLVNGLTIDTFFSSKVAFSYWLLMGLLLAGRRLEIETVKRRLPTLEKNDISPSSIGAMKPAVGSA
jgi:hypothetical protein